MTMFHYQHFGDDLNPGTVFQPEEIPPEYVRNAKAVVSHHEDTGYGHWRHQTVIWDGNHFHHYEQFGPGSMGEGGLEEEPWGGSFTERENNLKWAGLQHHIGKGLYKNYDPHSNKMIREYIAHHIPVSHRRIKHTPKVTSLLHVPEIAADAAEDAGHINIAKVLRHSDSGPLTQAFKEHRFGRSPDGSVHLLGPGYHRIYRNHVTPL